MLCKTSSIRHWLYRWVLSFFSLLDTSLVSTMWNATIFQRVLIQTVMSSSRFVILISCQFNCWFIQHHDDAIEFYNSASILSVVAVSSFVIAASVTFLLIIVILSLWVVKCDFILSTLTLCFKHAWMTVIKKQFIINVTYTHSSIIFSLHDLSSQSQSIMTDFNDSFVDCSAAVCNHSAAVHYAAEVIVSQICVINNSLYCTQIFNFCLTLFISTLSTFFHTCVVADTLLTHQSVICFQSLFLT